LGAAQTGLVRGAVFFSTAAALDQTKSWTERLGRFRSRPAVSGPRRPHTPSQKSAGEAYLRGNRRSSTLRSDWTLIPWDRPEQRGVLVHALWTRARTTRVPAAPWTNPPGPNRSLVHARHSSTVGRSRGSGPRPLGGPRLPGPEQPGPGRPGPTAGGPGPGHARTVQDRPASGPAGPIQFQHRRSGPKRGCLPAAVAHIRPVRPATTTTYDPGAVRQLEQRVGRVTSTGLGTFGRADTVNRRRAGPGCARSSDSMRRFEVPGHSCSATPQRANSWPLLATRAARSSSTARRRTAVPDDNFIAPPAIATNRARWPPRRTVPRVRHGPRRTPRPSQEHQTRHHA
jgi:hypothetical protein